MGKGSKTAASAAAAPSKDRTTKIARLRQMLTAADGVTVSAACATLGWKPHSVRAALSGLRKAGLAIERRSGGSSRRREPVPDREHGGRDMTAPEVARIGEMDRSALLALWAAEIGGAPPRHLSAVFLRRILAFELQSHQHGGLSAALRRDLARVPADGKRERSPRLRPGARLIREWNGMSHVVDVTPEGYLWRGERWRSLSAIARAITGARSSGPRFFGLAGGDGR